MYSFAGIFSNFPFFAAVNIISHLSLFCSVVIRVSFGIVPSS